MRDQARTEMYDSFDCQAGQHEVVASWGWPDQRQSWTWGAVSPGTNLTVRALGLTHVYVVVLYCVQTRGDRMLCWSASCERAPHA